MIDYAIRIFRLKEGQGMKISLGDQKKLNNDVEIPCIGLGVFAAKNGEETQVAVHYALEAGYRHVDTAMIYGNEEGVGKAIASSSLMREEIFITTKVWNEDQGYEKTLKACQASLERLGLDYIDLYLIHWPVDNRRYETWEAMIRLRDEGKCQAVGVSNFTVEMLEDFLDRYSVMPAVNQVEFTPYLYQKGLLEYCREKSIQLEAYSPLTRGKKLDDPKLVEIAQKYDKSTAQILIRWGLQHDIVVLPKSVHKSRIIDNINVFDFEISPEDMQRLDGFNENLRMIMPPWSPPGWK